MNVDDILAPSYKPRPAPIVEGASEKIPVIDIGAYLSGEPGALARNGAEMRHALEEIGFYFIVNHGVPQSLIDNTYEAAERFFSKLTLEQKMAMQLNEHMVGYVPMKASAPNLEAHQVKPNLVESFFMMQDLAADHPDVRAGKVFRSLDQWPDEDAVPGFRETACAYMRAMVNLGTSLLPLYAQALDLPFNWFDAAFSDPMHTLRISHYPQQEPDEGRQFGLQPHTDTSFMTLLPFNKVSGLSIRLANGKWVDVPSLPGSYLVNSGDILRRWSNSRLRSTPHKVVNASGKERYAIPFFMDCNYDWLMQPIPTCVSAEAPATFPPFTFAEYITLFRDHGYGSKIKKSQD